MLGQRLAELRAQAADVDVDRAVVVARPAAPDLGVELLAGHDPLRVGGERGQQLQLAHRQAQRAAVDQRGVLLGPDLQPALDACDEVLLTRIAMACRGMAEPSASGYPAVKLL